MRDLEAGEDKIGKLSRDLERVNQQVEEKEEAIVNLLKENKELSERANGL